MYWQSLSRHLDRQKYESLKQLESSKSDIVLCHCIYHGYHKVGVVKLKHICDSELILNVLI